jgi:hypothetical protein
VGGEQGRRGFMACGNGGQGEVHRRAGVRGPGPPPGFGVGGALPALFSFSSASLDDFRCHSDEWEGKLEASGRLPESRVCGFGLGQLGDYGFGLRHWCHVHIRL